MNISPPDKLTLYGHAVCPGVPPIKGVLKLSKIDYDYVDIHQNKEAAALVRAINDGYESVPTLIFTDGSALTEPSTAALKTKLESYGHQINAASWIVGNLWIIFVLVMILFALARFFGLF